MGFLSYYNQMVTITASFAIPSSLLLTDAVTELCVGLIWATENVANKAKKKWQEIAKYVRVLARLNEFF